MKFGVADYGMNVWSGGLYDIEERLVALKEIGFNGTERLEAVDSSDALCKSALYRRLGMDYSTCRGPSVQAGIQWTAALGRNYVWLTPGALSRDVDFDVFCRRANEMTRACSLYGIKAAIHNHMGQRIQNHDELVDFLERCPGAGIVLDTGHLSMAGGDPVDIVRKYCDRICVFHLKDVILTGETKEDGSADYRFCELGAGNNGFSNQAVIEALMDEGYDGWVHIEHDQHLRDPLEDLKISVQFLKDCGLSND